MTDKASPTGRATHEPSPDGLGLPVGIPDAVISAMVVLTRTRMAEILYEHEGFCDHMRGWHSNLREVPSWIESEIEKDFHSGDCTNESHPCMRCHADAALEQWDELAAMIIRAAKAMEARQGRDEGSVHDSAAREGSPEGGIDG